jgi:hypothetical protein
MAAYSEMTIAELELAIADEIARNNNDPDILHLEQTIIALIARKNAAAEGSAEYRMIVRQLSGLRYCYKDAGGIIEELDPFGWGETCHTSRPTD